MKDRISTFFGIILFGLGAFSLVCAGLVGLFMGVAAAPLGFLMVGVSSLFMSKMCLRWEWRHLMNFIPADVRVVFARLGKLRLKSWQKSVVLIAALFLAGAIWSTLQYTWSSWH